MKSKLIFSVLLLLLCFNNIYGQILGPGLESKKFEIGTYAKWLYRHWDPGFTPDTPWRSNLIFLKYGINKWFTITAEGIVFTYTVPKFPGRDYRIYKIGAGIIYTILDIKWFRTALSFHCHEVLYFDRSEETYHKNVRSYVGTAQFEFTFSRYGQDIAFWVAPGYYYDEITQYPYGSHEKTFDKSSNDFGVAFGYDFLLFNHINPFFYYTYADYLQPTIGISYQF